MNSGKTLSDLLPPEPAAKPEPVPAAKPEGGDAGGEGGEAPKAEGAEGSEAPKAEGAEGGEGGAEGEGEGKGEGEGGEGQGKGGEGEGEGAVDEALIVELPTRRPGEEAIKLALDSPETVERFRQMANEAATGREAQRVFEAAARKEAERAQFETTLRLDPVGFITENLRPELQHEVALQLLATPEVWDLVAASVEEMLDPSRREVMQERMKARRYELKDQLKRQFDTSARLEANGRDLSVAVSHLVPDGYSKDQAALFVRDALLDLGRYSTANRLNHIDPRDVPAILAARLTAVGVNPVEAAAKLARLAANGDGRLPARPAAPAAPKKPVVTAATLQAADKAKRAAAKGAPAGAGTPGLAPAAPPAKTSLKDATKYARDLLRSGK